jgi:cyclohexyl-isocyanide hydratase
VTTRGGAGAGMEFIPHKTFDMVPRVDLLWIPGGDPAALVVQMRNVNYVSFIQSRSLRAQLVTSVCEGALLAANAGLLDGFEATTHWAFINCLREYPKVRVAPGYPRFVHSGNRVTGGGISSGLDEALYLVKIIAGDSVANQVQETLQYFPKPPTSGSLPSTPPSCAMPQQLPIAPKPNPAAKG